MVRRRRWRRHTRLPEVDPLRSDYTIAFGHVHHRLGGLVVPLLHSADGQQRILQTPAVDSLRVQLFGEEQNTGEDDPSIRVGRFCENVSRPVDPLRRWQAIWRHVVRGELLQAIGRLRPLANPATIYVACNEPLPATLDVVPIYAAEIIPDMSTSTRRGDFQDRVLQYAQAMENLAAEGIDPTNRAICRKLGIKECNGFRYREEIERMDYWFDYDSKAVLTERRRVIAESWDVLVTL